MRARRMSTPGEPDPDVIKSGFGDGLKILYQ